MLYIIVIIVIVYVFYFISKSREKSKTIPLEKNKIPTHWHNLLLENILFYKKLTTDEQKIFCAKMVTFL